MKTVQQYDQKFEVTDTELVQITDDTMVCYVVFSECTKDSVPVHYRMGSNISPTVNEIPTVEFLSGFNPDDALVVRGKMGL
jgi:hypothetical protein